MAGIFSSSARSKATESFSVRLSRKKQRRALISSRIQRIRFRSGVMRLPMWLLTPLRNGTAVQGLPHRGPHLALRQVVHHGAGTGILAGARIADGLHGQVQQHLLAMAVGDLGALLGELLEGEHRHGEGHVLGTEPGHQFRGRVAQVVDDQGEPGQARSLGSVTGTFGSSLRGSGCLGSSFLGSGSLGSSFSGVRPGRCLSRFWPVSALVAKAVPWIQPWSGPSGCSPCR